MALFKAVVVVELPAIRRQAAAGGLPAAPGASATAAAAPRFVVILPHGDAAQLPRYVLEFCFPDLDQLVHRPYHYDHAVEEFVFTLTPKDQPAVRGERGCVRHTLSRARGPAGRRRAPFLRPRVCLLAEAPPARAPTLRSVRRSSFAQVHGFCRRYRVGTAAVGGRLDLTPCVRQPPPRGAARRVCARARACLPTRSSALVAPPLPSVRAGTRRRAWRTRRRRRRTSASASSPSGRTTASLASACSCCTLRGWRAGPWR